MVTLEVSLRLVTPNDVPLGVSVEGVHLRPVVVLYAGGLRGVLERLRSWLEKKLPGATAHCKNDDCRQCQPGCARNDLQEPEENPTHAP